MRIWEDVAAIAPVNGLQEALTAFARGETCVARLFDVCAEWDLPGAVQALSEEHAFLCDPDIAEHLIALGAAGRDDLLTAQISAERIRLRLSNGRGLIVFSRTQERRLCEAVRDAIGADRSRVLGFFRDVAPWLSCRRPLQGPLQSPAAARAPGASFAILSGGRTGSTLLLDVLAGNGIGAPREHLRPPVLALAHLRDTPFSLARWFEAVRRIDQVDGLFGTKIAPNFLMRLWPRLTRAQNRRLRGAFADWRFVFSYREDPVAQAISMFRADSSTVWEVISEEGLEAYRQMRAPRYDFEAIAYHYHFVQKYDAVVQQFLSGVAGPTMSLSYEALHADPEGEIGRVARFVGADPARIRVESGHRKIADVQSLELADRFRLELRGRLGRAP